MFIFIFFLFPSVKSSKFSRIKFLPFQTSALSQDGGTGTKFTLLSETTKNKKDKLHETTIFKTLDIMLRGKQDFYNTHEVVI